MALKDFLQALTSSAAAHRPEILIGAGAASLILSTGAGILATIKAKDEIRAAEEASEEPLTRKEKLKLVWKYYIPNVLLLGGGTACICCGVKDQTAKYAALVGAYTLQTQITDELKEKINTQLTDGKKSDIFKAIAEEQIDQNPIPEDQHKTHFGDEGSKYWCFDPITKAYFWSNKNEIDTAVNRVNRKMSTSPIDPSATYEDFLEEIDIDIYECRKRASVKLDKTGWDMNVNGFAEWYPTYVEGNNGEPVLAIEWANEPILSF